VESQSLVQIDIARRALIEASTIPEVKELRDKAQVIQDYMKQQKYSFEAQNHAAELKLRAERRLGEMLKEIERSEGGRPEKNSFHHGTSYQQVLKENEIGRTTAHRWQLESSMPEETFERFIAETKAEADELTSRAALGIAMRLKHEAKKGETCKAIIPDGLFSVISIDPPWPYGGNYNAFGHRVESPYREMSIEDIMATDIPAAHDCVLWLWATNTFMHESYHILEAWGFEPKTILTWFKQQTGVGYWLRGQTEHCILATVGQPQITHTAQGTALIAKATNHSAKPEEFYHLVESLCPGNKLEMFARSKRDGWKSYGDQLQERTV
jgi:N6-adenosine-specific RNA methylase IME4